MSTESNNETRADYAKQALVAWKQAKKEQVCPFYVGVSFDKEDLAEILSDLMHYADHEGVDIDQAAEAARAAYHLDLEKAAAENHAETMEDLESIEYTVTLHNYGEIASDVIDALNPEDALRLMREKADNIDDFEWEENNCGGEVEEITIHGPRGETLAHWMSDKLRRETASEDLLKAVKFFLLVVGDETYDGEAGEMRRINFARLNGAIVEGKAALLKAEVK